MKIVREPHVAGMFYPLSKEELEKQISKYFDNIKTVDNYDNILGIVSPHAGYMYSGKTAAAAFKNLIGKEFEDVIVISPSHREYFKGMSIYSGDAYKTPLGEININTELRDKLVSENDLIISSEKGHREEHALEVQLPFLQMTLNNFNLLPIVIGDQKKAYVFELANILSNYINNKTLVVVSSDLSHFYSKKEASLRDNKIAKLISNFDFDGLQSSLDTKKCEACGGGGIVTLLKMFKQKENKAVVLEQSDSGKITGDDSEVVGYLSALIYN